MSAEAAPLVLSGSFPVPASMLIRTELADLTVNVPGYTGGTIGALLDDWTDARDQASPQARDVGDLLARFADEVRGLVK